MMSWRVFSISNVSADIFRGHEVTQDFFVEFMHCAVKDGVKDTAECVCVLSWRTEPHICEIYCRELSSEFRVYRKAPRSAQFTFVCIEILVPSKEELKALMFVSCRCALRTTL